MTRPTSPLTQFLIALSRTPPEKLARACPEKLAAKYGVRVEHVRGYLRMGLGR